MYTLLDIFDHCILVLSLLKGEESEKTPAVKFVTHSCEKLILDLSERM